MTNHTDGTDTNVIVLRAIKAAEDEETRARGDHHVSTNRAPSDHDVSTNRAPSDHHASMSTNRAPSGYISLNESQSKVYDWLCRRGLNSCFNQRMISDALDMPFITVRRAVDKFEDRGLIVTSYDRERKMFDYRFNTDIEIKRSPTDHHESTNRAPLNNSSYNKPTTDERVITILAEKIEEDPDLSFWRDRNLSPHQVVEWMNETGIPIELMMASLKHSAFDLSKNKKDRPEAYFAATIKKARNYPRPAGFVSIEEQMLQAQKDELERLRKLREEREEVDREIAFEKMLADPQGDDYRHCDAQIAPINRRSLKRKQAALFAVFCRDIYAP